MILSEGDAKGRHDTALARTLHGENLLLTTLEIYTMHSGFLLLHKLKTSLKCKTFRVDGVSLHSDLVTRGKFILPTDF